MLVEANEIVYDRNNNTVAAVGNAHLFYQGKVVGKERFLNVIITKDGRCNDGMSETSYPARVHILSGKDLYTGCCK